MIIYNVTLKVNRSISEEWLEWLKKTHSKEMLETTLFYDCRICRLLEQDDTEDLTFVVQYYCRSLNDYRNYMENHAEAMRRKGTERFGTQVLGFRTLMEVLDEN